MDLTPLHPTPNDNPRAKRLAIGLLTALGLLITVAGLSTFNPRGTSNEETTVAVTTTIDSGTFDGGIEEESLEASGTIGNFSDFMGKASTETILLPNEGPTISNAARPAYTEQVRSDPPMCRADEVEEKRATSAHEPTLVEELLATPMPK